MEAFAHGCPEVGLELDEGNEREQSSEEEVRQAYAIFHRNIKA